jgi:hypothetical protein
MLVLESKKAKANNIKTVQIAFNLDDPLQEKLYKHVLKHRNASFYGKSLIQRDMYEQQAAQPVKQSKGGITYVAKN